MRWKNGGQSAADEKASVSLEALNDKGFINMKAGFCRTKACHAATAPCEK